VAGVSRSPQKGCRQKRVTKSLFACGRVEAVFECEMNRAEIDQLLGGHIDEHLRVVSSLRECSEAIGQIAEAWLNCLREGGKILFFGNGGSAADAQHLAAELVVRYRSNRRALAGLALTTDTSVLTAHSNDFGFETVFARQVEAMARSGDVVIGISTSGTSKNVMAGLRAANEAGCVTVAFTGAEGGPCAELSTLALKVPSNITAHVQECHLLVGHVLCGAVETFFSD
jgi:D-sedoheptulose 7-phosphate isomerase